MATGRSARWMFLTNHGHLLVALAAEPSALLANAARRVHLTERSARRIVRDLEASGYLRITRAGRRNRYAVSMQGRLRHAMFHGRPVAPLLRYLTRAAGARGGA